MKKPSVKTKCVANNYAMRNERIIEVTGQHGKGCLISIVNLENGEVLINVYRIDRDVKVNVSPERE